MQIPGTGVIGAKGQYMTSFGGYDHTWSAAENEFFEMENLSSRDFPMLSTRKERSGTVYTGVSRLISVDITNADGEPERALCMAKKRGTDAYFYFDAEGKAEQVFGRDTRNASYVYQAGYLYYLPKKPSSNLKFGACRISTLTTDSEKELLGNTAEVTRNSEFNWNLYDTEAVKNQATFYMQPCDSSGVINSAPKAFRTATGRNTQRDTDQLVIIDDKCTNFSGFNEWGITAFVGADGVVESVRKWLAVDKSELPANEKMLITGHGISAHWINDNIREGNYISVVGNSISVYESKESAEVLYTKPDNPTNGVKWRDRSTGALYIYSSYLERWSTITQNYIHFSLYCNDAADENGKYMFTCKRNGSPVPFRTDAEFYGKRYDIFEGFRAGDCIEISGMGEGLDGSYTVYSVKDDGLVLNGVCDKPHSFSIGTNDCVTVKRKIPKLDFAVEAGNRIWGCFCGKGEDGSVLNEIYCSALGDPFNWYRYDGNAADSWCATVGVGGRFTGAAVYGGYPIFFKENVIIRIYGTAPSSFQTVTYNYRGVKDGSADSLCVADEVLYWQSVDGIVAYTGGVPEKIDHALGDEKYSAAACGSIDGKLYVSTKDSHGACHLFVYDTRRGLWHREDGLCVDQFLRVRDELYMVSASGRVIKADTAGEGAFDWYCVSGNIGYSLSGKKYLRKVKIRAAMPVRSEMCVKVSYDGGEYEDCGTWSGEGFPEASARALGVPSGEGDVPFEISFIPRRCEAFRIRFEGRGQCRIISEYFEVE